MKLAKILFLAIAGILALAVGAAGESGGTSPEASPSSARAAAQSLIGRLLPAHADHFLCESIPQENGRDVFELESAGGKIILRGSNGLSIASALNWYLEKYGHCQVTGCGDNLDLPDPLPVVPAKVRKATPYRHRYAFNFCTFGYSMAFWDWPRWEREIDFMALHGINAPLAITGAEVVYRNVYRDLGLSDAEISKFIAGPPFLPWFFMSNIDGWGGPVPESWYVRQEALQKRILARQRELGMTPILSAFNGHVPPALQQRFPKAKISGLHAWSGFREGVKLLDPADPLFRDIGTRFIKETQRLFGTDHLYAADVFNEVTPPTDDPAYLRNISRAVYQPMVDADPEAVWFMQGWLFVHDPFWTLPRIENLLAGVPDDRMVIIDLFSDSKPQWQRTKGYFGKPWLWCIINNWGGKQGMYGRLTEVGETLPKLLHDPAAGNLAGIGVLPEGIDNNPIVYQQLFDMTWQDQPLDVAKWVEEYVTARYGSAQPDALRAWQILHEELYECRDQRHGPQGNYLAMVPTLAPEGSGFVRGPIFYDTRRIREAFRLLLSASGDLGSRDTYRHDLVDLGRQVMSDIAQQKLHAELRAARAAEDADRFDRAAAAYCEALLDCDKLLRTHTMFQLGRYLDFPRRAGATDAENAQWERNARMLITLWGGTLSGYAQRQYGGLMSDFNLPCWKIYLDGISRELHGKPAPAAETVASVTERWIRDRKAFPVAAEGDAVAVAKEILRKYCPPEADAKQGTVADQLIGRWSYTADGKRYAREFRSDGSLHLFIDGKPHPGWDGYTWEIKGDEVLLKKKDGSVFGKHRLKDAQTLLFIGESYGPAIREIRDKE